MESNIEELLCFEDVYLSARQDHWIQGSDNNIAFRKDSAFMTGEPEEAKQYYERTVQFSSNMRQSYCPAKGSLKSLAKIKIFQRTENRNPRTIINIKEVAATLQLFSIYPIEVVTTTEKAPLVDQIRLFNSFDILVTTPGSHLANGVFTMHPHNKAVLEIVPFVYDKLYYMNYINDLGFSEYIMSTGHLTPQSTIPVRINDVTKILANSTQFCGFRKYSDFATRKCNNVQVINPNTNTVQTVLSCASPFHSRSCNTFVNTTILYEHMKLLIENSLCKTVSNLRN